MTDDEGAAIETAAEVVADEGYQSRAVVLNLTVNGFRPYISKKDCGPQSWIDQRAARGRDANRRRIRGARGWPAASARELHERSFAHLYDAGGMRRPHLAGTTTS